MLCSAMILTTGTNPKQHQSAHSTTKPQHKVGLAAEHLCFAGLYETSQLHVKAALAALSMPHAHIP